MYFCCLNKDNTLRYFISNKTLEDLEFDQVIEQIQSFAITKLGKKQLSTLKPIKNKKELFKQLADVNEYVATFISENKLPNHDFFDLEKELKMLTIENAFLELSSFLNIATNVKTIHELSLFIVKLKDYFPSLVTQFETVSVKKEIVKIIEKVISPYAEIKNNASENLKSIRKEISKISATINGVFNKQMSHYSSLSYLDDIRESVVDNLRVLAVNSKHRRKIKGSILGTSKSGSIVFMLPESVQLMTQNLQNLQFEEKNEIIKILKQLTADVSPFVDDLQQYQEILTYFDVVGAKAKYAQNINACLPEINDKKEVSLIDAYHPLLLVANKEQKKETIPQSIKIDNEQRIIVISGPNAGGKSITLKTIGLLQVMLQSGILIPVNENSKTSLFNVILTDIGDNQSIENHLSTYSYRLKNMRTFLQKCNEDTLFLIDEFGTGSDPELGGALAEIFLEEFHQKGAYGIITTHYANLKVLADELPSVVNANMQFDTRTLLPLFTLQIGQAGSSFTFEVARKNGIPYSLINKAKKKVEREKIRLDKTISKLQGERNALRKTKESLTTINNEMEDVKSSLKKKEQKIKAKMEGFQALYDDNQKMLSYGRSVNELVNKYFQNNNLKQLMAGFKKWVLIEKDSYDKKLNEKSETKKAPIKKEKLSIQETKKVLQVKNKLKPSKRDLRILKKQQEKAEKEKKEMLAKIEKEVLLHVDDVRQEKTKLTKAEELERLNYQYKIKDRVRIIGTISVGTVEKIDKKTITINFGNMLTKAKKTTIELVEKAKR